MIIILLIILLLILLIVLILIRKEHFNGAFMTIVDPYSLYLHKHISDKETRWNYLHTGLRWI